MVAMSVLVEALNRSAVMNNSPSTKPQARPMPRMVAVLGMAAGACVGFGAMIAVGSIVLPGASAVLPVEAPATRSAAQAAPAPAQTVEPQKINAIRMMPILEGLAADMDYYRSSKPVVQASASSPAPAARPVSTPVQAAKPAAAAAPATAEPVARDPKAAAAIKTLEAQLERQPDNLETLNQLLGLISAQPPQAALGDLLRLYQAYPRQHVLAAQLGYTYSRVNDQESALRYQQWAVTMAPNNPVYLFNVAVLQDRLGKRDEAIRNYQQVLLRSDAGGPPVPTAAIRQRLDSLARR
jgi:hypothetical protein